MDKPPLQLTYGRPTKRHRRWLGIAAVILVLAALAWVGSVFWMFTGALDLGPAAIRGGTPGGAAVDLATWRQPQVAAYEASLAKWASWAKATFPAPSINPDVTLPPALNNLITHGPIEAVVMPDGQVLLLVQFEDDNLSTDSIGLVYASPAWKPGQIGNDPATGRQRVLIPGVWWTDIRAKVTPSLCTAEIDESPH